MADENEDVVALPGVAKQVEDDAVALPGNASEDEAVALPGAARAQSDESEAVTELQTAASSAVALPGSAGSGEAKAEAPEQKPQKEKARSKSKSKSKRPASSKSKAATKKRGKSKAKATGSNAKQASARPASGTSKEADKASKAKLGNEPAKTEPAAAVAPKPAAPAPAPSAPKVSEPAIESPPVRQESAYPVPTAQRRASTITAFSKNAGDASRSILFIVALALVAGLIWMFAFGKEPPAGLDEPGEVKIPKEVIDKALTEGADSPEVKEKVAEAVETQRAAAEAAKGEPVAAVTPTQAELILKTKPRVDVYIKGKKLGRTPLSQKMEPGYYRLAFRDRKLGINFTKGYRLAPGAIVKDDVVLGQSDLYLSAPDGTKVSLNGKSLGAAPFEPRKIYEGTYLLKATLGDKKLNDWVNVPPGKKFDYTIRMPE